MWKLVIGDKNYSSWSLRPWLLLTEAGIPFEEIALRLRTADFATEIARHSPAGRVPVLVDPDARPGGLHVWDSLAIAEYVAERCPERGLWPEDAAARAHARSVCAEMHSGFGALRDALPFNVEARLPGRGWNLDVQRDVDRIVALWRTCLAQSGGPLLFGAFTIADAFYAPVVSRFTTYGIDLPDDAAAYRDRVQALAGMRAWTTAALAERRFVAEAEPYRRRP